MTRRMFIKKSVARYPVWAVIGLALAVFMAGCAVGPPPGVMVGSSVAVSTGGDVGVAFGTGFGYAPLSPEQREMMERRSRFYNDDYYDDYPYGWFWD